MKISKGVEWAVHACALLGTLPDGWTLSADDLATYFETPAAYMAKHMQRLSKAGLIVSMRGAAGGYRLSRPPADISLWDVTAAIDGVKPSFVCTEIRQNGPCGSSQGRCKNPCAIAASFYQAEAAFRKVLAGISIADMMAAAAQEGDMHQAAKIGSWITEYSSKPAL